MNPFKYGQIVTASDYCQRPKLEEKLANEIRRGQNVYLQGERRTGKSSLIFETLRKLKKQAVLYVDILEIKTADDFLKRVVNGLVSIKPSPGIWNRAFKALAHLRPIASIDPITGAPTLTLDSSAEFNPESIPGVLDLIASYNKKTKPLVVVFDEFQDILKLKDASEILAQLRSKIQFLTEIPFIFTGSIRGRMDSIFNVPESAFFKSALPIHVGPLDNKLFHEFITVKFNSEGRSLAPGVLDLVFEFCFEVAGDIQQFCGALWDTTSHGDQISEKHIPLALEQIFAHESKGYETVLNIISAQQLKFLTGLARQGGHSPTSAKFLKASGIPQASSAQAALKRLIDLKILFYYENRYRFVNPFFRAWLLHKKL